MNAIVVGMERKKYTERLAGKLKGSEKYFDKSVKKRKTKWSLQENESEWLEDWDKGSGVLLFQSRNNLILTICILW